MALINGTPGDDPFLNGTPGDDRIYGFDGADRLYGGDGNDYLNPGNNTFYDWVDTGAGNDIIDFTDTTVSGSFYNIGHWGLSAGITVTVDGTANTATVDKGVNGTTTITNVVNALNATGIRFYGTEFDDVFNLAPGDGGSVQGRGFGGDDIFNIGAGNGDVTFDFRDAPVGVDVNLAAGIVGNDGYGGIDTITGPGHVNNVRGSYLDDTLRGSSRDERIYGDDGDDRIYGFDGVDRLYGGDGNDYLNPGNNTFYDWVDTGAGNDIIDFTDTTVSGSFYNIGHWGLSAGITVTVDGTANTATVDKGVNGTTTITNVVNALNATGIRFYGTEFDDVFNVVSGGSVDGVVIIRADGGDDTVNIGAGADRVVLEYRGGSVGVNANLATGIIANDGFGGSDTITGSGNVAMLRASFFDDMIIGSANDERFVLYTGTDTLDAGGGRDMLDYRYLPGDDAIDSLDVDLGAGTATGNYNGTAFVHTISGIEHVLGFDAGDDVIRGANAQRDVLEGNGGDDTLIGRGGRDTLKGGNGKDNLKGGNGKDNLKGGNGRDIMDGGTGNDRLIAGRGDDRLKGGKGNDRLDGGRGNDRLDGGKGDDTLTGGAGKDTFVFSSGDDVVTDFNTASNREKIDLSGVAAITGFNNLKNNFLGEVDGDAVIDDGNGNTMTLAGVGSGDLEKGDFIF